MASMVEIVAEAAFEREGSGTGIRLQPWELGDEPPQIARLLVDPDQAAWATHHVGQPVEVRDDGAIIIEVAVTNEVAFRSFVLTFLEHAEILEPADLRASMISWLEDLANRVATP
jgi:predicted DNA-binding transcriptional regulator YafY